MHLDRARIFRIGNNKRIVLGLSEMIRGRLQGHMRHLYPGKEFFLDVAPSNVFGGEVKGGVVERFEEFGRYRDDETWMGCESFRPIVRVSAEYVRDIQRIAVNLVVHEKKEIELFDPLVSAVNDFEKHNRAYDQFVRMAYITRADCSILDD